MAYQQPAQAYQTNSINTATPGELTLMLYNGALKFIKLAKAAIAEQRFDKAHENNMKVQNIIQELMITLDRKYPVAEQMFLLYEYIHQRMVEANIKKEAAILDEVEGLIVQFRDTWKQAMALAKTQG
ncbi:flagellar export chaperone FliS [Brevibacillus borstelensis]|uniref:flagellar export chaperone FliS n=1 Tax=Brevibacillus borstelensis TaxID=45462 RepID=UPI001490394A|nr:flagellar export chaperone FliS [Brevibacillus borstelensis]MCC0566458.1 flagellar export chaperone FliS [Brevibacillus borstelensis]MCM3470985.1 flagellar export chaperone FliS [Brevibacillus borstelensis]MCM3559953.1 flagellar export chaperone FliS [Brevibacillus borstelensis]MCM3623104.1 flagellar export chaperone FliS [Brevibacillus borstelensis]NOU58020.1 flagellar export chaperone FliS [Brevibacillus borstelensis]